MKVCGHNYYNYYLAQNGNVKTKVLSLLVFVIICSIFPPQVQSKYCASIEGKSGVCITIRRCPILFKILLPGYVSRDDLRQLQKLTCGFVKNDPKVCCPVDEVVHTNWPTYRAPEESYRSHVNYKNLPTTDTCGSINATMENRIIGGTTPEIASQPWLVRLGYRSGSVENDDLIFYCGGSIINKRYILTAAHCVAAEIPTIVRVGEYDSTIDPDCSAYTGKCSYVDDIGIEKIIIHSGHNPKTKTNDIALIRLAKDIIFDDDFVRPICLPLGEEFVPLGLGPSLSLSDSDADEKNKVKKATGFVAGWGATRWDELADSQVVQFTFLPIVSNEICRDIYSGRTVVSSKQLCAGGEDGKDSCDGDSGGPLVLYSENTQRYFHIGIVSYGPTRCGSKNLPGIYTRVTEYIPWILDHLSLGI